MNRYYLCQLNYEGPNSAEGFLQNLFSCYVIAFAQLGVIPRTRNKFDKIVAVAEYYLFKNHKKWRIKEAAVPRAPSSEISWWKDASQKGDKILHT